MCWLAGRVALVTGSASAGGAATARRLASEGAAVLVTDIQDEAGAQIAGEINANGARAVYVHLDVTSEAAVTVTLDEAGGVPAIVSSHLDVTARVPGLDPADFGAMVGEASDLCPVSRLLAGAKITVDAALEPAS